MSGIEPPLLAGVGANVPRPDGWDKVEGRYPYASDLRAAGMLIGVTVRSPHPHARIRSIDTRAAREASGVAAVLTHADVPGHKTYGLVKDDQPVLAGDVVRYQGEPVALVAAETDELARRAASLIVVDYEPLPAMTDPDEATDCAAQVRVRRGSPDLSAPVVVSGEYEVGIQDQAFLGPEAGLAVPCPDGGVELHVATQNLYYDLRQLCASLDLPPEMVRLTLAGVGGAFGGREDISVQIHACMLALRTGRPVRISYNRTESFLGHVHRHPARLHYEHGAGHDGVLRYVKARIRYDGGAYTSSSGAVCVNAATSAVGPYDCADVDIECSVAFTNNPPNGAMRGFGAVQTCFAYESQMDALARELGIDPVEIRRRNALGTGSTMPTGQVVDQPAPVRALLDRLAALPLPPEPGPGPRDPLLLPGGAGNTTHGEGLRRGVGYALGFKNVSFSAGKPDHSAAIVALKSADGGLAAEVHTSAAELGQGGITVQAQIARTELGVEQVTVLAADTRAPDAGSTSASRQTWLTGTAVKEAAAAVREELLRRASRDTGTGPRDLAVADGKIVHRKTGEVLADAADLIEPGQPIEAMREYLPPRTELLDENGQGNAHLGYQFAAHRAVVEVDTELGLVKVIELATAQDVGVALNPQSVEGQLHGGSAQGLGLALMEEVVIQDGKVLNPSFTDYLIPTVLDMPPMRLEILQTPHPGRPYGSNGMAEVPNITAPPAIVAAVRAATGADVRRIPIRPPDLLGLG
ncbi:xanthine dehydrogenase family protein molybdopterin-binding subunit [Amycolatopsis jejuensis]|uniref:xanthine dehydrogenase family protein molybdopterin-binding subunit n=1 Tax=Amycolatopsis jejuensis TaxID=330084 RepID=UPI000526477D|nr:molybdopterin cofactor-binding domain-containing protein [Amycolatopsis jejuensis]